MLDPTQLAAAGPWAVVVAIIAAIGYGVIRKWWVPGWVYDREVRANDALREQIAQLSKALFDEVRRNARARRPDDR